MVLIHIPTKHFSHANDFETVMDYLLMEGG